ADQREDLRVRDDELLEVIAREPKEQAISPGRYGRSGWLPGEQRYLAEDVAFLQGRQIDVVRGYLHRAVEDYVEPVGLRSLLDDDLRGSRLAEPELLHDLLPLRRIEILEQRRDRHHVVEQ